MQAYQMEDYDDCLTVPDKEGKLDLRYRGWNRLDDTLWTMGKELVSLNVAFNNIESLPPDLGNLILLKEFDCSGNRLIALPPELGKLKRLSRLRCNGNKLKQLPAELGQCQLLEELVASENELVDVPASLAELPALKVLKLQQNKLRRFNVYIAAIPTLQQLDLSFNPDLTKDFPDKWLSDTTMLIWICRIHQRYQDEVNLLKNSNKDLESITLLVKEAKLRLQDQLGELTEENKKLIAERPVNYMMIKGVLNKMGADVKYHVDLLQRSKACTIS